MADPILFKEFTHYLNFINDSKGRLEISELVKFDAAEFVIEQDDSGYARDISFMNEEISLEFYKGFFEKTNESYQTPNGIIVDELGHAIEWIFEYNKRYGFESEIQYILERNGLEFIVGELNFEGCDTDELTFFKCKVVQATRRAIVKRREDIEIDGFSDEDLDGNPITPLVTTNVLLKAKPVVQLSEWKSTQVAFYAFTPGGDISYLYQNPFINVLSSQIENTLAGSIDRIFPPDDVIADFNAKFYNFGYIDSVDDFISPIMNTNNIKLDYFIPVGENFSDNWFTPSVRAIQLLARVFEIGDNPSQDPVSFFTKSFYLPTYEPNPTSSVFEVEYLGQSPYPSNPSGIIGNSDHYRVTLPDVELELNDVPRGHRLSIVFYVNREQNVIQWIPDGSFKIKGTSTAIDTVIKSVRYIDLIKQSLKSINGTEVIAPKFESGGRFYDLFATSGNLIRGRDDVPFYFNFKERRANLMLMNSDVQINDDNAMVVQYNDYYDNVDNGAFIMLPDEDFKMAYNKRYALNSLEFGFKNYETDREEANTLNAVHTFNQRSILNKKVSGVKKIEIDDVFDAFYIEAQKRLAVRSTTALDGDNKIFGLDCVPLAPSTRGGFGASMTHFINEDGNLQLLKSADLPSWALLGFGLTSTFWITQGENIAQYQVIEITDTIITLLANFTDPTFEGVALTTVEYVFSNVQYTNRTNEGFTLIEGLLSPDKYSNLLYTIRRNLIDWESYMSTVADYIEADIKSTKFINNGDTTTRFGSGITYTENADIVLDEIQPAILSPREYDQNVVVEYEDVLALISKYQQLETIGGFVRLQDSRGAIKKVYPKRLGYTWATKVLNIVGEERKESDFVEVYRESETIFIDEVGYPIDMIPDVFYTITNDYVILYDINGINLINLTKFDKIRVSGISFDNTVDLAQALIDL